MVISRTSNWDHARQRDSERYCRIIGHIACIRSGHRPHYARDVPVHTTLTRKVIVASARLINRATSVIAVAAVLPETATTVAEWRDIGLTPRSNLAELEFLVIEKGEELKSNDCPYGVDMRKHPSRIQAKNYETSFRYSSPVEREEIGTADRPCDGNATSTTNNTLVNEPTTSRNVRGDYPWNHFSTSPLNHWTSGRRDTIWNRFYFLGLLRRYQSFTV